MTPNDTKPALVDVYHPGTYKRRDNGKKSKKKGAK